MNRRKDQRALGAPLQEKRAIVLDKSFVRSASGKQVREVCDLYRALMPEELFFEMVHSDEETKAKGFSKFPRRDNPVDLLPPVGVLMRYESDNRRPSVPIWNHALKGEWKFNDKLAAGTFELTSQQLEGVKAWESDLTLDAERFAERAKLIVKIFPALEGYRPGQDRAPIEEALKRIASNMEEVRQFYEWVAPDNFPPAPIVGRSWAVFRHIQVHLTADVEFLAKYGVGVNTISMARIENERTDLNYLILAVLSGGLASDDNAIKGRFRALCPDGILIEGRKNSEAQLEVQPDHPVSTAT
jgi:hypothetical protein